MKLILVVFSFLLVSCAPSMKFEYDTFNERADVALDEALHPKNSLEWWYVTGLLQDSITKDSFGVEFVIFHFNINGKQERVLTNIAVTDVKSNEFYFDHVLDKMENDLEASLPLDFVVSNKHAKATMTGAFGNYELLANSNKKDRNFGYSLTLNNNKKVLMHGSGTGYENYGNKAKAGYYSYTDIDASGKIWINGKDHFVRGKMWYDRQWNCANVLTLPNAGWDWMSINLNETNEQLMLYRVRVDKTERILGGTYLSSDGISEPLTSDQIELTEIREFKSQLSKDSYPTKFAIRIADKALDIEVDAVMDHQELEIKILPLITMHYWEGLCRVRGTSNGARVTGSSYLEMTNPENKNRP